MQRLIFEYSPIYFLLCLALGVGYAFLLYSARHTWSRTWNRILFGLRLVLVTVLMMLLLGPILKQTENLFEKPAFVFLIDNSQSVKETSDTAKILSNIRSLVSQVRGNNYDADMTALNGAVSDSIFFRSSSSDISSALRETVNNYEGKNLAGIILVSDGIYNHGISPLYQPMRIPVYTIGVGDTTERTDLVLKNVAYNRIVYQGNKFPLRTEVGVVGIPNQDITVTVSQLGKVLQMVKKNSGNKGLLEFDFQLDAASQGIQRLEVKVESVAKEMNLRNNRSNAFVEVVEGKKKILIIAPSPHPDIKALREVIEKNSNYECVVHIPGVTNVDPTYLQPGKADLVIAMQSPDIDGKTSAILTSFLKAKTSVMISIGARTNLKGLQTIGVPANFDAATQRDEVQPVLNPDFKDLAYSDNLNTRVSRYPPVTVPFGKFTYPSIAKVILHQRIGSVITDRPMLFTVELDQQKLAVLIADGIWKWRLNEYRETEKTDSFDELFSKLFQFLSTHDDRRKFRSFPIQQEFSSDVPVVVESQVYNDLFEPVYGNAVSLEIRDEQGRISKYNYVIGQTNSRYRIGGLKEGVYHYKATTEIRGKKEEVRGEFLVTEQNQESLNLTADFDLLRKLSENTGGKFYTSESLGNLKNDLFTLDAKSLIHSEETFNPIINLKAVFFILLVLVSLEWFLRKYFGSY